MDHDHTQAANPPTFWRSRWGLGCLVLAGVAGWFLWQEHRAHLLGALPYLILLACPLVHMFMHRGHHGHHHAEGARHGTPAAPPAQSRQEQP